MLRAVSGKGALAIPTHRVSAIWSDGHQYRLVAPSVACKLAHGLPCRPLSPTRASSSPASSAAATSAGALSTSSLPAVSTAITAPASQQQCWRHRVSGILRPLLRTPIPGLESAAKNHALAPAAAVAARRYQYVHSLCAPSLRGADDARATALTTCRTLNR